MFNNNRIFIVAEISSNHNQDFDIAVDTIKAIKESGADAVKVQTYTPDSLSIDIKGKYFGPRKNGLWKGIRPYDLYKRAAMPWSWQVKLKEISEKNGLIFFSSPFDFESVNFLERINVPIYKIASFEITDIPLIKYCAIKKKPMFISTGVADLSDIKYAIKACESVGNRDITLLKCISSYPARYEDVNLRTIPFLERRFGLKIGLSDHTLGMSVALGAVALGAKVIEKHFILDKKLNTLDSAFSMEPEEFKVMVRNIRIIEKALGDSEYKYTKIMKEARKMARSLFAIKDIKKREKFTKDNIKSLRPGAGLHPKEYENVIGRFAKRDIKKGEPLNWKIIENGKKSV